MPQITIDLDDQTAGQLHAICTDYDLTPSQLVARAVHRLSALIAPSPHQLPRSPAGPGAWIDALLPDTRANRG